MKKLPKRSLLLDRFHKGFVLTCVAVTAYAVVNLSVGWYRYITVLKPAAREKQLLEKQALLREGSSEILEDSSPTLTM